MLGHDYFYHANIRKIVSVFGALFNDIHIAKKVDNKLTSVQRVPLAYAPRERYLARLAEATRDEHIAIKLPRMTFEITDITYDSSSKLTKFNQTVQKDENGKCYHVHQAAPYNMTMDLNILSRSQDEALQIVEQILPFFAPVYNLSVKGMEGPESVTDVPISLNSIDTEDTYQGGIGDSRRTIIYTLNFGVKVKFSGPWIPCATPDDDSPGNDSPGNLWGGGDGSGLIKAIDVNFIRELDEDPFGGIEIKTELRNQMEDDFNCIVNLGPPLDPDRDIWPND